MVFYGLHAVLYWSLEGNGFTLPVYSVVPPISTYAFINRLLPSLFTLFLQNFAIHLLERVLSYLVRHIFVNLMAICFILFIRVVGYIIISVYVHSGAGRVLMGIRWS